MDICFKFIKESDNLVFSSINGVVGRGVVEEVVLAKSLDLPIYYIENNCLNLASNVTFDIIPDSKTARLYATVNY